MSNYRYDGTDDHMDSRLIEEDIVSIEEEFGLDYEEFQGPADFAAHIRHTFPHIGDLYEALHAFRDDAERASEGWEYGIQFVRKDAADGDWAKERAIDLGYIEVPFESSDGRTLYERAEAMLDRWPLSNIDWDAAAVALYEDAQEFEFRGTTYFED